MMLASMLSIVYYSLQNAIRFLWENIRSWCAICVCLQRESEVGVTQELALQSRGLAVCKTNFEDEMSTT
jgi:hypothetical protein